MVHRVSAEKISGVNGFPGSPQKNSRVVGIEPNQVYQECREHDQVQEVLHLTLCPTLHVL